MFRDLLASRIPRPALATVAIVLGSLCIGLVSAGERVRQGNVSQPNSGAAEAQEVFLYGLAQLHNFQYDDASQLQRARPGHFAAATRRFDSVFRQPGDNRFEHAADRCRS